MALDTSKPEMQSIGNYDLIDKIAEGGMGWVYKGRHRQTGQIVAIKIMPVAHGPQRSAAQALRAGIPRRQPARPSQHRSRPRLRRHRQYAVSGHGVRRRRIAGPEDRARAARCRRPKPIRIIAQVCQGLHRAHKQDMIHRDIKPDNIMVTPRRRRPSWPTWAWSRKRTPS